MNHSAAVLRNKGVCVQVNETVDADGVWQIDRDPDGNPKAAKAWIRFDGNTLADLEEAFGGMAGYQVATAQKTWQAARRTLSIVFGWDDLHDPKDPAGKLCSGCRRAGLAMRDGGLNDYTEAIGAALALANGLDPTQVVKMLEQAGKVAEETQRKRAEALDQLLAASTSPTGSPSGSAPVEATTSSGG